MSVILLNPSLFKIDTKVLPPRPWDTRPDPSKYTGFHVIFTDLNNSEFYSDGMYWRPCGQQDIFHKNGLLSAPLATISNNTGGTFAIANPVIPAGLIIPNSKLAVQCTGRKIGANATSAMQVIFGGGNSSLTDPTIANITSSSGTNVDIVISCGAKFGTSDTNYLTQNFIGEGTTSSSNALLQVERTNLSKISPMYINVVIGNANALDSFALHSLRVTYEA